MEEIAKCGVKREAGYLYFIDVDGNVARTKMARAGQKTDRKIEVVAKTGIKKEKGYLYFLDKKGNVSRAKMARKGK
jgi:20S proteasome alpha/beta subunit